MRTEAGCDPTGEAPCDRALESAVGDGVLLEFPPGQYRFEQEHRFDGLERFGIVGTGRDRGEVEFVFPSGFSGIVLGLWHGGDWLLENFTVQQSMDARTGVGLVLVANRALTMRDVEIAGFSPYNRDGGQRGLYCVVLDSDGVAEIERYVHRDPSHVGNYPQGTQAFLADEYHRGALYCRDWHIENAGENGVYASRTPGAVRVEGGYFRNNDVASIRVCGKGSYVENATVVVDTNDQHPGNAGSFDNTRGIWWESGPLSKSGGHVANCDLIMRSTTESQGLLRVERTAGAVSVRNCRLVNQTGWPTVSAVPPLRRVGGQRIGVHAEDLSIRSLASGWPALGLAGRPTSSLTRVTVNSPAREGDAVRLADSPGTQVTGGTFRAARFPLRITPRRGTGACQLRSSDPVELRSASFQGRLLLDAAETRRADDARPAWCVPADFGVPYDSVVLTAFDRQGLYGHLLGPDGRIIFKSDTATTRAG